MRTVNLILFLFTTCQTGFSQIDVGIIDRWILLCDSTLTVDTYERLYIVDGIFIEVDSIENELNRINSLGPHFTIDFFKSDNLESTIFRPDLVMVQVSSYNKQAKRRRIKKILRGLRKEFPKPVIWSTHIPFDTSVPVLLIEGVPVSYFDFWNRLFNLKMNEIFQIGRTKNAPKSLFGELAKNGMIQVWLK